MHGLKLCQGFWTKFRPRPSVCCGCLPACPPLSPLNMVWALSLTCVLTHSCDIACSLQALSLHTLHIGAFCKDIIQCQLMTFVLEYWYNSYKPDLCYSLLAIRSKGSDHLAHSWGGLGSSLGSQWDGQLKFSAYASFFQKTMYSYGNVSAFLSK